jgi:hypothetical protein
MSNHVKKVRTPLKDGNWKITTLVFGNAPDQYSYIEHQCPKPAVGFPMRWHQMYHHPDTRGVPCVGCKESPPEGMQAVFWFLRSNERE